MLNTDVDTINHQYNSTIVQLPRHAFPTNTTDNILRHQLHLLTVNIHHYHHHYFAIKSPTINMTTITNTMP